MPRPRPTMLLSFALLSLVGLHGASAQITTNATCLSNWADLYNSKGQSPCLVGAYLGGACNGGQYDVPSLESEQHYIGPTSIIENPCLCNTVMYSMMGACSICQNATTISWPSWSVDCSAVYISAFPEDIPQDTAVPGWAYKSTYSQGSSSTSFDVTVALQDNSPESTATRQQSTNTGTSGTRTGSSATGTATSGVGEDDTNKDDGGSNTGAIAGGVVGGVVGLALIALLGFFLFKRNKNKNARIAGPGTDLTGSSYGGGVGTHKEEYAPVPYTPNAYDGSAVAGTPGAGNGGGMGSPPMAQTQKLYDPNDPSTFPTTPLPNSIHNQSTGQSYTPSFPQPMSVNASTPTHDSNQGMYRGVAEV